MIITEVNSCLDLVHKASKFANQLQDGWYKGSAEVDSFKAQVSILRQKHDQWNAQLRRHGVSDDERLLQAVQAAVEVLDEQEQYVNKLQRYRFLRLRRKAFPGQLTYVLRNVSNIVDTGPQLLTARVDTFDVLERIVAQTPAPLPFIPDPDYVPITNSVLEIRTALEDEQGPRVVTVFGGPGLGKSSVVKYLALQYEEERKQGLTQPQRKALSFPDGVYYLFCGKDAQDRVKQLEVELVECLGFGPGSSSAPPNDQTGNGIQEGAYIQLPSHQMKLRSRLAQQNLLIVLDDLWERKALKHLLQMVPAKGVRYLVTSQRKDIWGPAAKIQMRYPTVAEARRIMSNYTDGLPTKGQFPHIIQTVTDAIIENVGYLPLSLADVGTSVNSSRATDASHWKAINDNLNHVLLHEDDFQLGPVMYEKSYNLTSGASMMLMVESLRPDARQLLFMIALLGGDHLPETLVRYFYKRIQPAQSTGMDRLNYDHLEKYLAERSLVDLHMQGNASSWERMPYMHMRRTVAGHCLRMRLIREKKSLDVRSIAAQILESSNQGGTDVIEKWDAEATLVKILSAVYFQEPFTDVVVNTLEKHLRILDDGTIPRNVSMGIDPHDLVKGSATRYQIEGLVWLIDVDRGDPAWKQQAYGYVKKIIIKLACQGKLDDYSMASLLQLPQTTSVACEVFENYVWAFRSYDGTETVSRAHGETINTLLALLHDDGVSTTRRVRVIRALARVLDYESKDIILSVAAKYMELLVMDFSNSTLQIGVVQNLYTVSNGATRAALLMGEFTGILDLLMELLVSGKDFQVRVSAGDTLRWFCQWKFTALKVAAIPDALEKLFNLFVTTETLQQVASPEPQYAFLTSPSYLAGQILGDLSCVQENRIKFRALQSRLDGFGNILVRLKGTWQGSLSEKRRPGLRERASTAAGILAQLARDTELKHSISLPGLEEGLLFLQLIQTAMIPPYFRRDLRVNNSTMALTKLFSASTNPRSRCIPTLKQVQEVFSSDERPPAMGAAACFRIYWSRVEIHCEMGAYAEALQTLELAQLLLDQCRAPDLDQGQILSDWYVTTDGFVGTGFLATIVLSRTRRFLQFMSGHHAGALLDANEEVESAQLHANEEVESAQLHANENFWLLLSALKERGILRRLCGELQGALDDLDAAYQLVKEHSAYKDDLFYILKHRGYVKYLMNDEVGARADAEAALQQPLQNTVRTITDERWFWDIHRLPINYLGYFSSSKPSLF